MLPPHPLATTLTVGASGPVEPALTWARYVTPSRWSQWSPQIRRVECTCPDEALVPGRIGTVIGPGGLSVSFTATEVDERAHRWTWVVRLSTISLQMTHGVEPRCDGSAGARAWVRISGPLPVVVAYAPLARVALTRLVSGRIAE